MSKTPEQFLTENMKWIALVFLCLFLFKSMQSCTRQMSLTKTQKESVKIIDSLKRINANDIDSIKELNTELRIANIKVDAAQKNAVDVNNAAKNKSDVYVTNKIVSPTEPNEKK